MASLIKRENSPYWFAAFDVVRPDGTVRRLKKSTKKRKRSEAMVVAIRLEELEKARNQDIPEKGSKVYSVLAEAASAAAKGELSEGRARDLLSRITELSTGEPLKFYTVRSWAEDWLAAKSSSSKKSTILRYRCSIEALIEWMGDKADRRLEAVTKSEIRNFRDFIYKDEGRPRSARTANCYVADVAGMFRAAVREGLLLASPASALEKLPEHDSNQREVFTLAEVSKLLEASGLMEWQEQIYSPRFLMLDIAARRSEDWPGVILLGFYAGARLRDCATMSWDNVDLERKVLSFMPAKTERKKKKLEIPLHPRLQKFLMEKAEKPSEDGYLFPSLYNTSVGGLTGLSGQFKAIMIAAGVDPKTLRPAVRNKEGRTVVRSVQAKTFHSLRHSLTSNLDNLDVSEEIRRRIVGHESADVYAKYTHTERETLARALEKLPSI